jgi:hypothetical protein
MGFRDKATHAIGAQAQALAKDALDAGGGYYCPVLPKASAIAVGIDTWALALDSIESAGWRLRAWAVLPDGSARPLFERDYDRVVDSPTITP